MTIHDSYAVVRNNTERSHICFTWFSPVATFCKTVLLYHNKDIDIDNIYWSYLHFPSYPCTHVSLCVYVSVFMCMHLSIGIYLFLTLICMLKVYKMIWYTYM